MHAPDNMQPAPAANQPCRPPPAPHRIVRPLNSLPLRLRMADSAVGMSKNSMKPKPRGLPVSRSVTILQGRGAAASGWRAHHTSAGRCSPPTEHPGAPDVLDRADLAEVVDHILLRQVVRQVSHCSRPEEQKVSSTQGGAARSSGGGGQQANARAPSAAGYASRGRSARC